MKQIKSNSGYENVVVSFEKSDSIQISKIKFHYNRFLNLNIDKVKSMGRFGIQLLLSDNIRSTRYIFLKTIRMVNHQHNGPRLV